MLVNGHGEDIASRLVDDAEAIAFPSNHILNEERNCGTTLETAMTVEGTGVRDGDNSGSNVSSEKRDGRVVPEVALVSCYKV